jgi:hypothetical protein
MRGFVTTYLKCSFMDATCDALFFHVLQCAILNPAVSAYPAACCGVSERMGNIISPNRSKILRDLLRRASIQLTGSLKKNGEFRNYICNLHGVSLMN